MSRAQDVLKQVDAMRQYQEDVDNLNEVAHNRPRAQLVLGIQQENRHIRTLQQVSYSIFFIGFQKYFSL